MTTDPIGIEKLQQIPAFRNFNAGEYHQLLDIAREKTFAPGQKVIEQGKSSQYLWIVLEGECEVVRASRRDGTTVLAALAPHSLFGEMSFFSPAPHSASVLAKTPVKLLAIARADYDDLIRDDVAAAYKLAFNIVDSVVAKLRRMDERMAEFAANVEDHGTDEKRREWRRFREKMFDGWSL